MSKTHNLLQVEGLNKNFGGLTAINNLGFSLKKGELLGLVGPNGSGKTTLFNLLTGFLKPDGGRIIFEGRNISGRKPHQITGCGIGRTFQITKLFNQVSTLQNVLMGLHSVTKTGLWGALTRHAKARREEVQCLATAMGILQLMELEHALGRNAENLSSAEQRRLMIAVALATNPKLLLLDEPIAGMGAVEIDELMGMLAKIRQKGIAILLIEHNMRLVMGISDRIVAINYGTKIAEGLPADIVTDQAVIEAYLGKDDHAPY